MPICTAGKPELASELALHFEEGRDYERATRYMMLAARTQRTDFPTATPFKSSGALSNSFARRRPALTPSWKLRFFSASAIRTTSSVRYPIRLRLMKLR